MVHITFKLNTFEKYSCMPAHVFSDGVRVLQDEFFYIYICLDFVSNLSCLSRIPKYNSACSLATLQIDSEESTSIYHHNKKKKQYQFS